MSASTSYAIDAANDRYPFCIVWTPIPIITWLLPFVGHMGICDSHGVIHDFAGPYFISRDNMAFGRPVKYWCLHPSHTATLESLRGGNPSRLAGEAGHVVVPGPDEAHVDKESLNGGGGVAASALVTSPNTTVIDSSHRVAHQQSLPPPPLTATDMWDAGVYRAAEMYRKMNYNFFCNNCHSFVGTALEQMELISLNNPYNNNRGLGAFSPASSAAATASFSMLSARKEFLAGSSSRGAGSSSPSAPGFAAQQPSRTIDHARRAVVGDTVMQLKTWNMVTIGAQIFFFGKYVSFGKFLLAHLPFLIIIAIVVSLGYMGSALSK